MDYISLSVNKASLRGTHLFWYITEAVPVRVEVGEILQFTDGVRELREKVLRQDQLLQTFTAKQKLKSTLNLNLT